MYVPDSQFVQDDEENESTGRHNSTTTTTGDVRDDRHPAATQPHVLITTTKVLCLPYSLTCIYCLCPTFSTWSFYDLLMFRCARKNYLCLMVLKLSMHLLLRGT